MRTAGPGGALRARPPRRRAGIGLRPGDGFDDEEEAMAFFMSRWEEVTLFLLRVVTGFLFAQHGAQKILAWFGGMPPAGGSAPVGTQAWVGGWLELVGGLLIILGLFTRVVAFVLSGMMAVAYFQVHAPQGFWPILNGGELAALYCFLFLYLSSRGGGRWSVDGMRAKPGATTDAERAHRAA
jgi:putative oxidoreductase